MTSTTQASGASPVDFATFGDYGDFKPKKAAVPRPPSRVILSARRTRSRAGSRPMAPAATRPSRVAITCTSPGRARGRTAPPSCATCSACRTSSRCRRSIRCATAEAGHSARATATAWTRSTALPCSARPTRRPSLAMTATSRYRCCGTGRRSASSATTSPTSRSTWTPSSAPGPIPAYDLYPEHLRPQIDEINELVYATVNNGVYRSGFATTQESYHEAVTRLFATLDVLEAAPGRAPVPARRRDHRGRRAAVGDAGPVRRRLLLALQVQPAPDHRLPEPVGLRARPVRAARLPQHHQVRPDQAALLHDAPAPESVPDRAGRPAAGLGRPSPAASTWPAR